MLRVLVDVHDLVILGRIGLWILRWKVRVGVLFLCWADGHLWVLVDLDHVITLQSLLLICNFFYLVHDLLILLV